MPGSRVHVDPLRGRSISQLYVIISTHVKLWGCKVPKVSKLYPQTKPRLVCKSEKKNIKKQKNISEFLKIY